MARFGAACPWPLHSLLLFLVSNWRIAGKDLEKLVAVGSGATSAAGRRLTPKDCRVTSKGSLWAALLGWAGREGGGLQNRGLCMSAAGSWRIPFPDF